MVGAVDGGLRFQRHRCKSYNCAVCGGPKLRRARRRIGELAGEHHLQRLLTLTLDPAKVRDRSQSIPYIRECWRKMRVSLSRRCGTVRFIFVLELQGNGMAHPHILIGAFLPKAWVSAAWSAVGGGRVVDIRWVDVHRVSAYVAKYLTKESLGELPDGVRRFSCSRGLVLWSREPATGKWVDAAAAD